MAKTILIVDDERPICEVLSELLEDAGYRVECAHNGQEALDRLGTVRPDLIILDMWMPVVDGWEVLRILRAQPHWSHIPVIVLSANYHMLCGDEHLPIQGFMKKPFESDALLAEIDRLTGPSSEASVPARQSGRSTPFWQSGVSSASA